MTKMLMRDMLSQLNTKFPEIKKISRELSTNNLCIYSNGHSYIRKSGKKEEEVKPSFSFIISCNSPKTKAEPYTTETLEKAFKEYPALFEHEISVIKQNPDFISFSTYNAPLTQEELEKDINHVFNYSIYNLETDPVRKAAMIKTLNNIPLLPKTSKNKRNNFFQNN